MATHNTLVTGIPVGKYEVVREIGRGGVAVVYLANQPGLDRHVALKELSAAHAHDPAFAERFLREARIAGSLNHSNIVSVYDYFEIDGVPYIAMEYLSQGSLRHHMAELKLAQIGVVMDALLAALSHSAANSVVHRDVKPENLLIGADGVVKVADFGVAKALLSASDNNATVTGMTVGTPAYMAPEQAIGRNVGSHSDVYAAGIVAYELICGATPFDDAETPVAMLYRHVHDAPTPPTALRPDLHPHIEEWVLTLLDKAPEKRPTAGAAREQLDEIMIAELGPRWRRDATSIVTTPDDASHLDAPSGARTSPALTSNGAAASTDRERGFRTFAPRLGARRRGRTDTASPTATTHPLNARAVATTGAATVVVDPAATQPALRTLRPAEPAVQRQPRRRRVIAVGAGAIALAAAGGAIAILPGDETAPPPPATPVADDLPTTRPDVAIRGKTAVIADPTGRVLSLNVNTLTVTARAREPRTPRAAVSLTNGYLVADAAAVTLRDTASLAATRVTPTGPQTLLAEAKDVAVVAFRDGSANGRLCRVTPTGALAPCIVLGFAPTGLGASASHVVVADGTGGQVVVFTLGASLIVRTSAIAVGRGPHGRVVVDSSGRIAVPIERGVSVADIAAEQLSARVPLPTTPADLAAVPDTGQVLAALPGSNAVALIDANRPNDAARLLDAGTRPLAVAATGDGRAVVVNAGGSVGSLNLDSGEIDRRAPLPAAGPSTGATLTRVSARQSGRTTIVTLTLDQPLDAPALSSLTGRITEGSATFSLWQGGISTQVKRRRPASGQVEFAFAERPGRLRVRLTATPGRIESVATKLSADGRRVIVTLTEPAPRVVPRRVTPQATPQIPSPGRTPSRPPARPSPPQVIVPE